MLIFMDFNIMVLLHVNFTLTELYIVFRDVCQEKKFPFGEIRECKLVLIFENLLGSYFFHNGDSPLNLFCLVILIPLSYF